MKKQPLLVIIGIFFIALNLAGIILNIKADTAYNLIWFCNHTALILGLAILFRSRFWVTAQICIGFFPQLFWTIDFFSKLIFDRYIFYITDYMFTPQYNKWLYILSWNHVFMLPIALIGLYLLGGATKDAWKGSLIHGIVLIPLSYMIQNGLNYNCMHQSCIFFIPTTLVYKILWPPLFIVLVIIPTNMLLYWLYRKILLKIKNQPSKKR